MFADEAFGTRDKSLIGALKTLITESHRMLEQKHIDAIEFRNFVRLIMSSNEEWAVPAEFDERRFFVVKVSDAKKGDTAYFQAIIQERDNGGKEALLDFLMKRDLSGKDLRKFPVTNALISQKLRSLKPHEQWLYHVLQLGEIHNQASEASLPKDQLYSLYVDYCIRMKAHHSIDVGSFYKGLYKMIPATEQRPRIDGKLTRMITFPPLAECRSAFEQWVDGKIDWSV